MEPAGAPGHGLGMVGELPREERPDRCHTDLVRPADVSGNGYRTHPTDRAPYDWTDLTYLLHKANVSWKYYVAQGGQPDCADAQMFCSTQWQDANTPDIWNPLPGFETVHANGQLANIQPSANYFRDAAAGTLPSVSWIVPNQRNSEHPPASIPRGAGVGHEDRERGHAESRLEQHGDLPFVG